MTLRSPLLAFVSVLALAGAVSAQDAPQEPPAAETPPRIEMLPPPADPNSTEEPEEADAPMDPETAAAAAEDAARALLAEAPPWAPSPRDAQGRTAYGLYLAGRNAMSSGEGRAGAGLLGEVERLTPEQTRVAEQAFTASLLSGDLDDAARIAPKGPGVSPTISEAGKLISAVQAYVHGDPRAALAALQVDPVLAPHAPTAKLILPWIAAEAGDWAAATTQPATLSGDELDQMVALSRAQIAESRGQFDEAERAMRTLGSPITALPLFRLSYGEFLERRGRRDEAIALYDAALAVRPDDPQTGAARDRARSGATPPRLPSYRNGAARAMTLAGILASRAGANEFAAVYLRLSLNIQPTDETRYYLAEMLAKAGVESSAREVYASIPASDPDTYAAARGRIGIIHAGEDRPEEALAEFRDAVRADPGNPALTRLLASQLLSMERYDEALTLLNGPLLNTASQTPDIRFMRGAAYESLGRVPEAEAELWAALQARPADATYLNYLGYLWVDSGTRVAEGAEMIGRAHALEPDNGNIQDSLGWAQYRQGEYEAAVGTLEQAVAKEPANAEINDHLGDAYWQVGRKREAGFQWSRVLTLDPDAERKASVEKKLADGLAPAEPVSGTR